MTGSHHYRIIQNMFTALKILCDLPVHHLSLSEPLTTNDLFIVSVLLLFPVNPKGNNPEYSLEGLMAKLKLQYFSHLM